MPPGPGSTRGWSKTKAGPGAAGDHVRDPEVLAGTVWGRAGPRAPEHPPVPTRCSPGCEPGSGPAAKMLNLGSGSTPSPARGQRGASPFGQTPHLPSPPARPTNNRPPLPPRWVFLGRAATPTGLSPAGTGEAALAAGAGRAPGPAGSSRAADPRHILSLPAPGRPRASRVTLPAAWPRWPPPLTQRGGQQPQAKAMAARLGPSILQGWGVRGEEKPPRVLQKGAGGP